jgi:hypothetical protein
MYFQIGVQACWKKADTDRWHREPRGIYGVTSKRQDQDCRGRPNLDADEKRGGANIWNHRYPENRRRSLPMLNPKTFRFRLVIRWQTVAGSSRAHQPQCAADFKLSLDRAAAH